jgi:glutamate synthase domain-containing protein 2
MAEHMAKAVICGADLVAVDTALLVSLGCRVCRDAHSLNIDGATIQATVPSLCPAEIDSVDSAYAAQRMINLMGSWHNQLIEVLGAMGIREVRRLRGEMGRAIFMEEIEKEAFGDLLQISQQQASA